MGVLQDSVIAMSWNRDDPSPDPLPQGEGEVNWVAARYPLNVSR